MSNKVLTTQEREVARKVFNLFTLIKIEINTLPLESRLWGFSLLVRALVKYVERKYRTSVASSSKVSFSRN